MIGCKMFTSNLYLTPVFKKIRRKLLYTVTASLSVVVLVGCQTTSNFSEIDSSQIPTREMEMDYEYRLEAGDRVALHFLFNEELNDEILVAPDGNVSLRMVGNVAFAGHTIPELDETLTQKYDEHIAIPDLTVSLKSVSTQRVFVGGEVNLPGVYEADGGLTLTQAIFMAGGYKSSGKISSVVVLRDMGDPVLDYYIVDVGTDLSTLSNFQDLRLRGRDIVFVPQSNVGSINQFLNLHLKGLKEILSVFNFTATYELRDFE